MYFLYLLELEAVARAGPLLASMNLGPEDAALHTSLQTIVEAAAAFPSRLDTAALFSLEDGKAELLDQVKVKAAS
jgi:hypothetical protein